MYLRRFRIHIPNTQNAATKMNSRLALTFNLTGALFMAIWTPFFVLSLLDIKSDLLDSKHHANMNFSLRCNLLILGGAKPFIYLVCLDKFRKSFNCGRRDAFETENTSSANRPGNTSSGKNSAQVKETFLFAVSITKPDVSTV
ncbi:hypothetical protein DPMN_041604 [Dreissena polymorpha]|uniref:G-protein coupled receptors family 1 profile domain-containing protein n=1 Tax=Dreissena polymorpha TaxID=45954 RepID=A0A9D4HWC9_DREPO|nr:hypothetical protein DPMN_041604 [Dreissena polymorpha]